MTATYTWGVFSTLDGYGSFTEGADWGGYWGKQGPELLLHVAGHPRLAGRDHRERRRRGHRRRAQAAVGRAASLAGQPVAELGTDGRRPGPTASR